MTLLDLRCRSCGRRVGYTTRTQPVPVQCTHPFCTLDPPASQNEERDSFIEHLSTVAGVRPERLGHVVGLARQGVARVLASRRP